MIGVVSRFRAFLRPYRGLLVLGTVLSLAETALDLAKPWPLKFIVDNVLKASPHVAHTSQPILGGASPQALLVAAIGALLAIVGTSALADYWSTRLLAGAGERVGNDIRERLFAHLQRLSLRYHGHHEVGELTARVTSDVDRVQDMLVDGLSVLLPNALLMVGMAAVMFAVDPLFAAMALASSPFMALAIYRSTFNLKRASRRARRFGGRVSSAATEGLGAIQVVQALSLEDRSEDEFRALNRASLDATLRAVKYQARLSPVVDLAAALSTAAVLWLGTNRVLSGRLTVGLLIVFVSYVGSLYRPIRQLSKFGYTLTRGAVSGERIRAALEETSEVADGPGAKAAPPFRGRIEFADVWFSFGREPVLRGMDLSIEPGEILAVVGPTGAGKSTLAALIPRLFDPQAGSVRIDGVDVREYSLRSLRSQVAMVLQDTVLFRGSLRDNIACGKPDASEAEIRRAADLALVDEFAQRLPEGYDTPLGERGVNLSGGQRQRVAIARALVRDAPILVLDEPTSALDAGAEALVIEGLQNLMAGRTTVVLAHRLSTVRHAHRIVVLSQGEIVEQGAHGDLVKADGAYARLVRLQAPPAPAKTTQRRGSTGDDEAAETLSHLPSRGREARRDEASSAVEPASTEINRPDLTSEGPLLYVLKRFPRLSETFVLREIVSLEALGERILIDSLLPAEVNPGHPELGRLRARPRYLPKRPRLRRLGVGLTHLRLAVRAPATWTRLALRARRTGSWTRFLQAGLVAARALNEEVRHIHAHFATAAAEVARDAGKLAGIPVTVTAHAKDIFQVDNVRLLPVRLQGVSALVTVSDFNANYLRRVLPAVPVHHVPNGVAVAYQRAAVPPDGPILCVARLVPKKGVDVLVQATAILVAEFPDTTIEVIGGGPLAEELSALSRELEVELHVRFLGPRPWNEVDTALMRCSVFALPARITPDGDRDGMPTALVEAAARGVTLISTNIAGIPELVRHEDTGLLVPPEDPWALAAAIARLRREPALARRLGENARALVAEQFDPVRSARRLQSLFERAAG